MIKIACNVNRSGKLSHDGGGSANIPFDPGIALPVGEFVTFVTNQGMMVEPEVVLQYGFPRSPRPVYAVFYTKRNIGIRLVMSIDMIVYADSYTFVEHEGYSYCVVLGHSRNLTPGSIATFNPQCLALAARYEGIPAIANHNSVFIPTFFKIEDGAVGPSMWTAAMDMQQRDSWAVTSINWNDGNLNNLDIKFARTPVSTFGLEPIWFPYVAMDESRTKYPIAVADNGSSLYWICWRPTVAGADQEGNNLYSMDPKLFSQDTMDVVGTSIDNAAQIFFLGA